MANITTVSLTSGVPTGPTGAATVSTLDNLIGTAGAPIPSVLSVQGITSMIPLKTDGTATIQPVSGSVSASQSGAWSVRCQDGAGNLLSSQTRGTQQALSIQVLDSSGNQITSFGGTPLSSFGSAFPLSGIAIGAKDSGGLNLQPLNLDASGNLKTVVGNASLTVAGTVTSNQGTGGGSAWLVTGAGGTFPVTGTFWQATQPVSIAATVNVSATQNGTWTVQPGNTANTTAWLVTGAGGTFPITAAALPLPAGASTAANQATAAGQGSATSGQTGTLAMGAVTTGSPVYTTAQTSPLSLDTTGALRVNVTAGSGGGGTASSFGTTFPSTGTAAGAEYLSSPPTLTTGQMVALQTDVNGNLKTSLAGTATVSGTVTANQGGAPWTIKPDGTAWALTGTSANVNLTNASVAVTGTFWQATQPISVASLPLPSGAATSANQPTAAAIGSTTSGQTGNLAMGAVTTAAPSYTTATTNSLSLTTAGALRIDGSAVTQPVSGTFWQATQPVSIASAVTVQQPTAANLNATVTGTVAATQSGTWTDRIVGNTGGAFDFASTQNIATPAQCILTGGEFNTAPTTITSGNSSPLQLDSAGNLLVNIKSSITQAVSQSGTWTVQPGNTQNTTPWLTRQSQTAASNGLTASRVVAAATTNATSLKASAGNIAAIDLFNVAAYMVFLKLYNKASAPTVGTDTPVWTIPIPASGGFSIVFNEGEYFSTGIAFAITKLQADSDTTAIAAGDVTGRIKWV